MRISRRHFVLAAAAASASCVSPGVPAAAKGGDGAMDEALDALANTGPEYAGGLANHGPMAADALVALGRPDAVLPWVERYRRGLQGRPEARRPIPRDGWREALGDYARVGDWIAFFDRELKEAPWRGVLGEWSARLAPGLVAAAAHGLIRTGHAARSLGAKETEARRHELAEGLAYWAARYQTLPDAPAAGVRARRPSEAVRDVERLPDDRRGRGLISDVLRRLDGHTPFGRAASLADASGDPSAFVSDLTETFAAVYLANASRGGLISFIHAVTGPSAARLLIPHVPRDAQPHLLRYGWQAAAAIYAAYAVAPPSAPAGGVPLGREELIDRAVAAGDEHAIKFTEACLREHALNPKPVYLLAAADACERLG